MHRTAPILALAALAAPAAAQTPVDVPRFDGVSVEGGGDVVVRHGAAQRVSFTATRPELVEIKVERGKLLIRPCRRSCRDQKLTVEVVTPSLGAASIHGGGDLRIERGFPRRDELALSVHGGGRLDAGNAGAEEVAAAVHGGGHIETGAPRSLAANIHGGGVIRTAAPRSLTVAIHGGGTVKYCGKLGAKTVAINGGGTITESCSR